MRLQRWLGGLAVMGTITACTLPPASAVPAAPPAPIGQRVLVPTATPESSTAMTSSMDDTTAPATAPTPTTTTALTADQAALLATLPSRGAAPELFNGTWFNAEPLKLADLRGKVILVEFWTFDCINCRHVIPSVQEWHDQYQDDGLVIIGVHTPEFAYEKDLNNVQAAITKLGVTWPVAIDNDWTTWRSYENHYWPAIYLIDKQGNIRLLKIGEGQYEYTESVIQALLAEPLPS